MKNLVQFLCEGVTKWTYDSCKKEASKYKSRSEFSYKNAPAYGVARKNGWLDDYDWFERPEIYNKKWNYNTCKEEAKKYKSRGEFKIGSNGAYDKARKEGWLDEYDWFEKSKTTKKWNYDTCKEEAKKYKSKLEFRNGNGSAYGVALQNKWLDEYDWFEQKKNPNGFWTKEKCEEAAKSCSSKTEFSKKFPQPYRLAKKEGWMKTYDWFEQKQNPSGFWTKEKCEEEAKNYKTRGEFCKGNASAYQKARKEGWLKDYDWLKDERFDRFKDPIDSVYAYEFNDLNAVYVGRTLIRRQKDRDQAHIHEIEKDAVAKFAKENDVPVPKMKIVATDLTIAQGAEQEGEWVEKYKEQGWNILNRTKTGSIGGLGKGKWTKEACEREAMKYQDKTLFIKECPSAYQVAKKEGWIEEYTWLATKTKSKGYWTKEKVEEIAKKCKTLTEFSKYVQPHKLARKYGWIEDFKWLDKGKKQNGYWNYDTCKEEASKYKSRGEFQKGNGSAYGVALQNKWLDDYDWFIDEKTARSEARIKWNYDTCKEEAKKYKTRGEFCKGNASAYNKARKEGWLGKFFPHKSLREFVEDYTKVIV